MSLMYQYAYIIWGYVKDSHLVEAFNRSSEVFSCSDTKDSEIWLRLSKKYSRKKNNSSASR